MAEHFIIGPVNSFVGFDEQEITRLSNELFQEAPIEFNPRKNNKADELVSGILKTLNITVPVVPHHKSGYMFGTKHLTLDKMNGDCLMTNIGGGYTRFDEYLKEN